MRRPKPIRRLLYFWRRLRQAVLFRSGLRRLRFIMNRRRLEADIRAGIEHKGRVPAVGITMIIHPQMYLRCAYVSELFEVPVVYFIRDWLRSGDTFIDVGANVGLFTLLGARCVGARGRVIAFEPGRFAFEMLERNCRLNGLRWVECERKALGECEKDITLNEGEPGFDAYTSVGPVVHPSAKAGTFTPVTVPQVVGDDWGAAYGKGGIRLIKIDVEGAELGVIRGFAKTLSNAAIDAILVEITQDMSKACGFSSGVLWDTLQEQGYSWWTPKNHGGLEPATNVTPSQTMYIALRPGLDPEL